MNRYYTVSLVALLVLVIALPIYALLEPQRMAAAQGQLQARFTADGAAMYVDNCAVCHGPGGEGIGSMPSLNRLGEGQASRSALYDIVAHSPHGTVMSAWHVDEGGSLNHYQVESLITLIMNGDWERVDAMAANRRLESPEISSPDEELATMEGTGEDPHECRACHEEPDVHAERFGLNCSRCHTLQAWKPALLTRHTFFLDHGGEGKVSCQTCHVESYASNTCYGCHEHVPADMQAVHLAEGIEELEPCATCHPTGLEGEAAALGYGLSGQGGADADWQSGDQILGDEIPSLEAPTGTDYPGEQESDGTDSDPDARVRGK
jgi:mono/diheme cytochrome c family protein